MNSPARFSLPVWAGRSDVSLGALSHLSGSKVSIQFNAVGQTFSVKTICTRPLSRSGLWGGLRGQLAL